jgi:hypothetical protein
MNGIRRTTQLILAGLAFVLLAGGPQRAAAAPLGETVTVLVDVTTPAGTSVVGTVMVQRSCTATTSAEYMFNGTVNGLPASAGVSAIERWTGGGHADITITAIHDWHIAGVEPSILTVGLLQTAPGLLGVNGVPLAVDQRVQVPCAGPSTYMVRNAGQGQIAIALLPNTGMGADLTLFAPSSAPSETLVLAGVALLVGLSSLLTLVPWLRRRGARRGV